MVMDQHYSSNQTQYLSKDLILLLHSNSWQIISVLSALSRYVSKLVNQNYVPNLIDFLYSILNMNSPRLTDELVAQGYSFTQTRSQESLRVKQQ